MDNEGVHVPMPLLWQVLDQRQDAVRNFGEGADAWLKEHPAIRVRIDILLGTHQVGGDGAAILEYLRSEAHPAAIFALAMVRNFADIPGVQMDGVMQLVRTVFAAGYQQALRDAMDEEIIV